MIHFFLNIKKYYEEELENGFEIQAVACIEYPIIHVIARTIETMEEEYDELDKFIVLAAYKHERLTISQLSELTGIGSSVFVYRAKELVRQEYISFVNDIIKPEERGIDFANKPTFEREIEKTRSFILDGVTHAPLRNYFYKDGKGNLISEDERDSWGNKIFNPAIIHNPPTRNLAEIILKIPLEARAQYSIPAHLKGIKDYDFVLMTYPIAVVFSKGKNEEVRKKIVDGFVRNANAESVANWQKSLESEILKMEVIVEERDLGQEGAKSKKIQFKNNWGNTRGVVEGRIFNIPKDKLKYFIQKLFGLETLNESNICLNEVEITLKVDKTLFESKGADKSKILEACIRGRDYFRQYEGTGIWLVFFKITIGDEYIQELVELKKLVGQEFLLLDLLRKYHNDYAILRTNFIAIERLDKLEELDIYLFLHSRDTNFNQTYLTLENE